MAHSKKDHTFDDEETAKQFIRDTKAQRLPDEDIYTSGPFKNEDGKWVVNVEIYWG